MISPGCTACAWHVAQHCWPAAMVVAGNPNLPVVNRCSRGGSSGPLPVSSRADRAKACCDGGWLSTWHRTTFSVNGMALFTHQPISAGEQIIEYKGEVTSWRLAASRQRAEAGCTLAFSLSDGRVIDGSCADNSSRFLNLMPAPPNYEAIETGEQVFIHARRHRTRREILHDQLRNVAFCAPRACTRGVVSCTAT